MYGFKSRFSRACIFYRLLRARRSSSRLDGEFEDATASLLEGITSSTEELETFDGDAMEPACQHAEYNILLLASVP